MSNISKKQIQHIAKLARIELTQKEEEKFTKDLSSILSYIEQLDKVNLKGIKRIDQITGVRDVIRKDELGSKRKIEKILKNAPQLKGEYIQVPKILE